MNPKSCKLQHQEQQQTTEQQVAQRQPGLEFASVEDRKSTRLNSSHPSISYAVFCLKKKKKKKLKNTNTQTIILLTKTCSSLYTDFRLDTQHIISTLPLSWTHHCSNHHSPDILRSSL